MRKHIMDHIRSHSHLKGYLREQPVWYRKLSRNPGELQAFEISALHYYGKTIPQRVEKITNGVQLAGMMLSLLPLLNDRE